MIPFLKFYSFDILLYFLVLFIGLKSHDLSILKVCSWSLSIFKLSRFSSYVWKKRKPYWINRVFVCLCVTVSLLRFFWTDSGKIISGLSSVAVLIKTLIWKQRKIFRLPFVLSHLFTKNNTAERFPLLDNELLQASTSPGPVFLTTSVFLRPSRGP